MDLTANGLPRLADDNFHRLIPEIMETVGNWETTLGEWPPIPDRHPILSGLESQLVKKPQQEGKDSKTSGYVWGEIDPQALLFNRMIARSCHTLNNFQTDYRVGNYQHIYNPWFFGIFAGAVDPRSDESIVSAKSCIKENHDKTIYIQAGGKRLSMRKHQAATNAYITRCKDGKAYIYLVRNYDTCPEFPWSQAIIDYTAAFCEKTGLGLVLSHAWENYPISQCRISTQWGELKLISLETPLFTNPLGEYLLPHFPDGGMSIYSAWTEQRRLGFINSCPGYVKIDSKIKLDIPARNDNTHLREIKWALNQLRTYRCESCDIILLRNNTAFSDPEGERHYCGDCYERYFVVCGLCNTRHNEQSFLSLPINDTGYTSCCEGCWQRLVISCSHCREETMRDNSRSLPYSYDRLCPTCYLTLRNTLRDSQRRVRSEIRRFMGEMASSNEGPCYKDLLVLIGKALADSTGGLLREDYYCACKTCRNFSEIREIIDKNNRILAESTLENLIGGLVEELSGVYGRADKIGIRGGVNCDCEGCRFISVSRYLFGTNNAGLTEKKIVDAVLEARQGFTSVPFTKVFKGLYRHAPGRYMEFLREKIESGVAYEPDYRKAVLDITRLLGLKVRLLE